MTKKTRQSALMSKTLNKKTDVYGGALCLIVKTMISHPKIRRKVPESAGIQPIWR